MTTAGVVAARHPFTPSGDVLVASNGRRIPRCGTCSKARNAPAHRRNVRPATPAEVAGLRDLVPLAALPPLAPPPPAVRRESLALALALDAALDAGILDAASLVYATALRAIIGVPQFRRPEPDTESEWPGLAEHVDPPPRDPRTPPQDPGDVPGVPWAPRPNGHHAPGPAPAQARARAATKGIRNDRIRALATRAVADGWRPRRTGDGHLRLELEGHRPLVLSMTATADGRSWRNARAAAKRAGVDVAGL